MGRLLYESESGELQELHIQGKCWKDGKEIFRVGLGGNPTQRDLDGVRDLLSDRLKDPAVYYNVGLASNVEVVPEGPTVSIQ